MAKINKKNHYVVPSVVSTPKTNTIVPVKRPPKESLDLKDALKSYLQQISKNKLLTPEEEKILTEKLFETGDIEIAKSLVMANLRLVVKIAMEYRHSYQNILDLIQEGNIGLMKAVSKFNPNSGAKLSYYASWWIRSYILKFILDNFRLVKIGTTQEQKKLFYNLMREKNRLMAQGIDPTVKLLSQNLDVSEKSVTEMQQRLESQGSEISLDQFSLDDDGPSLHDLIPDDRESVEEELGFSQGLQILQQNLGQFLAELKPRDREIFEKRLLSEIPESLQSIADQYGVTRERIRQVEERLINRLKEYMKDYIN
ncbi:MAG: RNA polymerase factor sigma-32 [Bacteriovoracaceae bacterium]|nr:RNA polymerase factor sigma-32 [Bacteriovoracaceae bacterium]